MSDTRKMNNEEAREVRISARRRYVPPAVLSSTCFETVAMACNLVLGGCEVPAS